MKIKYLWLPLILALALMGCKKDDPSVLHLPEQTSVPQGTEVTPAPLTPAGDRVCTVGQETLPESQVFSLTVNEVTFDPQNGLLVKLSFTNKSPDRTFIISLDQLAVNGYMQSAPFAASVPPTLSGSGELRVPVENLRTAGISTVDELVLYPLVYDENVPQGQGDAVDGAFSFYPTGKTAQTVAYPVRQISTSEQTVVDNGFGAVILMGVEQDAQGQQVLRAYLENRTDRFISFEFENVSVNGEAQAQSWSKALAGGKRAYAAFALPQGQISTITFNLVAVPLPYAEGTEPLIRQAGSYGVSAAAATPAAEGGESVLAVTPTPTAGTQIYTKPTKEQTKNAKKGYLAKDKVNLRSGPGTSYKIVQEDVAEYTSLTLYELQNGWWFLKCGSKYGYIRQDMVAQGTAPKAPEGGSSDSSTYEGTVVTQSVAALRKEADKDSKCLKELKNDTKLTVYYKTRGTDGKTWYYVSDGKQKGFIRSDLIKTSKNVPSR